MAIESKDWSFKTNWSIASGSLQHCITFDDYDVEDEVGPTSAPKSSSSPSPLVLAPPSPHSGPCEINIGFPQKREVLQVYVRSTARVYEIYCEPDVQSGNEYLCTVRCGIASRDGKVLQALNVEEIVSSHVKGCNEELAEENSRSEDDWVDVKNSDFPVLDGGNHGLPTKSCIESVESCQDLFEATAEVSDVNPCISVTLRLLSLQNKSCIWIDEIYMFVAPVAQADSEVQESRIENSSSSSLMAMFLPTLMQLSKTSALSNMNDKHPHVRKEKQYFPEVDQGNRHQGDSVINNTQLDERISKTDHQERELQTFKEESAGPSQSDKILHDAPVDSNLTTNSQAALMESKQSEASSQAAKMKSSDQDTPSEATTAKDTNRGDYLGINVESALELLVSRMDRMEAICLGFQEKMVVPITNIEARLQQVEQQLETLTIKFQNPGSPSHSRVYGLDGSCIQSNANSCDDCHGNNVTEGLKPDNCGSHIEVPSVSANNMSDLSNTSQLHPGLTFTAPEFLDVEDEEESKTPGLETTSNDKPRQPISIDDAVASAFAGFLSSLSSETPRYTKSLVVRAPEFINDDDHENNDASPRTSDEIENNDDSSHHKGTENANWMQESTSNNVHSEREKMNGGPNDKESEEVCEESEEYCQHSTAEDDQKDVYIEAGVVAEYDQGMSSEHTVDDNKSRNISGQINDGLSSKSNIKSLEKSFSGSSTDGEVCDQCQTDGISDSSTDEVCESTEGTNIVASEVQKKAAHEDIMDNVLGFSRGSSTVDFETSILDVQFISQGNHVTKSYLEALVDTPETSSQDHIVGKNNDDLFTNKQLRTNDNVSVAEQNNLIPLDFGEPVNPALNAQVDKDYFDTIKTIEPVQVEGGNLQEHKRKRMEEDIFS